MRGLISAATICGGSAALWMLILWAVGAYR